MGGKYRFAVVAGMALALAAAQGATSASASQQTSVTVVMSNFTDGSVYAGQKTSDIGSSFHKCTPGGITSCVNTDNQSSIPKNIGNVLCLASGTSKSVESSCQTLLDASSGSCQNNSAKGSCGSGMIAVYPSCNYRTNSSSSVSANWQWLLTKSGTGSITVGCNQVGYTGPNKN
jgi:hypothetical protein